MRSNLFSRLKLSSVGILTLGLFSITTLTAQESEIDWRAVTICDRMSDMIGDLNSCSFSVSTVSDVQRNQAYTDIEGQGLFTRHRFSDVYFRGHNNMMVDTKGDGGHQTVRYDGYTLSIYSYTENNYITVDAPDSTINMIYAINERYGVGGRSVKH